MAREAEMARPERFELPTARFVAEYSIQLSYGRFDWSCCRGGKFAVTAFAWRGDGDYRDTVWKILMYCSFGGISVASATGLIRSLRFLTPAGRTACVQIRCANLSNLVQIPLCRLTEWQCGRCGISVIKWRRERDSNPRRGISPYSLSRGALSTTQPSLRIRLICVNLGGKTHPLSQRARYLTGG